MHELIDNLYELCETIEKEIGESNKKIRTAGGKLSGADVEYVDKLTHTLKSIKAVMAMIEDEDGYSNRDGGRMSDMYPRDGVSYRGSYARGRGRNARRDAMGRYSSERGYSRAADEIVEQLEDMMDTAPDDRTRKELKKLIEKMRDE